jgi:hypothetical protein
MRFSETFPDAQMLMNPDCRSIGRESEILV